jgi:thioredoxin 1
MMDAEARRMAGLSVWSDMAKLVDVTDESFDLDVLRAAGTTVVDFWAPWCGPCLKLTPHLERLAESLDAMTRLVKMDIESQPDTASRLRVRGLPVLIAFREGEELARLRGVNSPRDVEHWLRGLEALPTASEQVGPALGS